MLDDDTERRLRAMALWYHTREAGGHFAFTSAYEDALPGEFGGYRESSIPLMIGEAMETFDCLQKLHNTLRLSLWAEYLRIGPGGEKLRDRNQDQVAERYFHISLATYKRRLHEARVQIRIQIRLARDVANAPYVHAVGH